MANTSSFGSIETSTMLTNDEISRYGRQLILPEWGVTGQLKVKSSSVLIVGVGGLGCPAAQYLAATGWGTIGLVDYDSVEASNLHRQVLHTETRVGVTKVDSAREFLQSLNSQVKVKCHSLLLDSGNACNIIKNYDVVLDATDNVVTRYLLNDACVLLKKPLVSGSALRFEGQLTVYNYNNGPCYRCLFPSPPPPHLVTNCSEGGVLGVVPGVIGSLQALEAIKIVTGIGISLSGKLLLFDGLSGLFRHITIRSRDSNCSVCGENPTITELIDYVQFCGSNPDDKETHTDLLDTTLRITCQEYKSLLDNGTDHVLVDVREPVEYNICHLSHSINIPLRSLQKTSSSSFFADLIPHNSKVPVYVICRHGNDSQLAVPLLQKALGESVTFINDIKGGLCNWHKTIDNNFPIY